MIDTSSIKYRTIGLIRTPFKEKQGVPIQSCYSSVEGRIELLPQYAEGLSYLDGFSHLILLYHFHNADKVKLKVIPFLGKKERGVFATRAPVRPNPIGISIVELKSIDFSNKILKIKGVDIIDSTPLLDIKPYIPLFDQLDAKTGWITPSLRETQKETLSDDRF
ncbi:MAG: tRNA (N6-threonylcarbamoyladenosine(37)-N6)-methyltransferase TrmO [Candidatus Hodarchaeales archaeon]|jgi:tRNA-Thr(GGU) m(6)t(6)A37 methyltransferase TsaA